jgi:hypothetical protein
MDLFLGWFRGGLWAEVLDQAGSGAFAYIFDCRSSVTFVSELLRDGEHSSIGGNQPEPHVRFGVDEYLERTCHEFAPSKAPLPFEPWRVHACQDLAGRIRDFVKPDQSIHLNGTAGSPATMFPERGCAHKGQRSRIGRKHGETGSCLG